ncbi:hypothetical protein [Vibrio mexicanus]|uniref:hypothetical protein n=1 Tax=Vibrio mexicanus TaxID=1004326 RepID=UPI00063CEF01|nr:hypothetical protein [Vibrio mexicanus]
MWVNDLVNDIDSSRIDFEYGYNWVVMPFVNLIPRALWQDKPLTSTSNILSEKVYDIRVGDGQPITTFTIWGEGYWQAGLPGVILATFLFFIVSCAFVYLLTMFQHTNYLAIYYIVNIAPFVRAEIPMFLVLTNLFALLTLIVVSYLLPSKRA